MCNQDNNKKNIDFSVLATEVPSPEISDRFRAAVASRRANIITAGTEKDAALYHDFVFSKGAFDGALGADELDQEQEEYLAELVDTVSEYTQRGLLKKSLSHAFGDVARHFEKKVEDIDGQEDVGDYYRKIGTKISKCRNAGSHGIMQKFWESGDSSAERRICWDNKCGYSKLCPDCARQDARRLQKKYIPLINQFLKKSRKRRAYYHVFTLPTIEQGKLQEGMRAIFAKFTKMWRRAYYTKTGLTHLKGALVVLECHLTAKGQWHPHLNVLALTEGNWDYDFLWKEWRHADGVGMLDSQLIEKDGLEESMQELIKYVAKHQGSPDKDGNMRPAMEDWTAEQLKEWWDAFAGTRRIRSYGCLNGEVLEEDEKEEEPIASEFHALGRVFWNHDKRQFNVSMARIPGGSPVDLILGNKSYKGESEKKKKNKFSSPGGAPPPKIPSSP